MQNRWFDNQADIQTGVPIVIYRIENQMQTEASSGQAREPRLMNSAAMLIYKAADDAGLA